MLKDSSNLFHLLAFAAYLGVLLSMAGNVRVKRLRNASSLIQLSVVLLCVDLLLGFFVIQQAYGSNASASWISKSLYGMPLVLVLSLGWMLRAHSRHKRAHRSGDD